MRIAHFQHPGHFGAAYPPLNIGLSLLLYSLAPIAHAARPMMTGDARVVDAKACQLESWSKISRGSTEYWAQPACNFTGNLEITLGGSRTHDNSDTFTSDLTVQGKTILKTLEPDGWGLGFAAGTVRHPQLGGGTDLYAYVPLSLSFKNDQFVLHTNTDWLREQETKRNYLTWGVGAEVQLNERTWLIAETFGQNQGKPYYQMGLRYWIVPDRIQVNTT